MKKIFLLLICFSWVMLFPVHINAQECTDENIGKVASSTDQDFLERLGAKCEERIRDMQNAIKLHQSELERLNRAIDAFLSRIKTIEADVAKKSAQITQGEKELEGQFVLASRRIREFYIRSFRRNVISLFFSSDDIGSVLRTVGYQQAAINEDKRIIAQTATNVKDLELKRKALQDERALLASLKADTDRRAESIRKIVQEANAYESKVQGYLATITAQQQAILNARGGTFTTSVGDVPLADDPNASPNYNPGFSPAFAAFSFGAYTHRKGMSQYGAKGRAQSGQNFSQILQAYYGKTPASKDTGGDIRVSGHGSINFEDRYLMGIAEMPSNFPMEALKAQAIAARTYAYRYKVQGLEICTTQACQVYSASKANNPPSEWRQAVQETRGQVIEDVVTYYSSTTGEFSLTSGWDTTCGNQGCWTGGAYEKIASSPWFYKGWYTSDYYNDSAKCGRSHPWLSQEEFADILNAWQVRKNGGDATRILPVTINTCNVGGQSGNPYSLAELRSEAANHGGAFTTITGVSVSYSTNGYTQSVTVQTNKGTVTIPGNEFVETYNIRAPGYISIRGVVSGNHALFNIEKR